MYKIIVHMKIGYGGLSIGNVHLALRDHSIKCSFSKKKTLTVPLAAKDVVLRV
jgi:hypothetical protein